MLFTGVLGKTFGYTRRRVLGESSLESRPWRVVLGEFLANLGEF